MRKRVYCWLPTPVYSSKYHRDGFRWFQHAWFGSDGKHYTKQSDFDVIQRRPSAWRQVIKAWLTFTVLWVLACAIGDAFLRDTPIVWVMLYGLGCGIIATNVTSQLHRVRLF